MAVANSPGRGPFLEQHRTACEVSHCLHRDEFACRRIDDRSREGSQLLEAPRPQVAEPRSSEADRSMSPPVGRTFVETHERFGEVVDADLAAVDVVARERRRR